jgi:hypothetical protein
VLSDSFDARPAAGIELDAGYRTNAKQCRQCGDGVTMLCLINWGQITDTVVW